ncbi:HD domain-containing protein [Clostridium sp. MCC353]|uniref:HD domain-containing protein n=1 Tax=Clostridium sp. MCC353 TaxID=2592646 RepID=UPI001C02EDD5|nr:HD domain-containing protein [Clostridium sp. MCC353]MBT9779140.1 HD domain-containing protein [Clostridium sp. MCC353]
MNFKHAEEIFEKYLDQYDREDDKIKLKIIHTYGVISAMDYLTADLKLTVEDTEIARHTALLHDIGRFEQLRLYNSFDDAIMPHAQCSLDILFEKRLIESFIPERTYDTIIYTAIKNHGLYRMEEGLKGQVLLHSRLIRDADKMDNFRVKDVSDMKTMVDVSEEELGREEITDEIYQKFLNHIPILNSERRTHMDMWISYLGYIYDFNFPSGLKYLLERDYITRLVKRVPYSNAKTAERMKTVHAAAMDYLKAAALPKM